MALPTEYDTENESIARRQKYAEMLRQQSLDPLQTNQMAGGYVVPVSPVQGIAKLLQAYKGKQGIEGAEQQRRDLIGRMDAERSTDMQALAQALRGQPARPQQFDPQEAEQNQDQGTPMPQFPATPGDPNQAAMIALQSRLPDVRQMAPGLMQIGETRQNRQEDRDFRASESAERRAAEARALELRLEDQRISRAEKTALEERLVRLRGEMQQDNVRLAASLRPAPQPSAPIITDTGIYERNRDGSLRQLVDPATNKPLMPKAPAGKAGKTDVDKTMDLYVAASNGLISGLDNATTGPLAGRLPAMTTSAQIAEGGVAAMAPVLKQLFRVAGEGTFTDKDQELLLNMVPTRKDTAEARKQKISNIDTIVAAKLGLPIPDRGEKPKPITAAQPSSVDALLDKYK